ncbi:MAG: PEP-CTERM sorting domain-containing protein [Phycisphaerales bacterium]|jgi:hypothetical protein|nr:PEP-CTERM sorting domain-containing protein [Phycisphaerales bacterium]
MKRSTLVTGLVAVMMLASVASGAVIDTFGAGPVGYSASSGATDTGTQDGLSTDAVVGGSREVTLLHTFGDGDVTFDIGSDTAVYSSDNSTSGKFTLAYGNMQDGGTSGPVMHADFTGENFLRVQYVLPLGRPDHEYTLKAIINSGTNSTAEYQVSVSALDTVTLINYATPTIGSIVKDDITGISLEFDASSLNSAALDMEFQLIDSVVPEPATMSLLALGGMAFLKRRKRA